MGNTLFRRVAAGSFAAAAAVGLSTMFATPASAHASSVTGSVECVSVDGRYNITWTLTNDHKDVVTLSEVALQLDDAKAASTLSTTTVPASIAGRPGNAGPLKTVSFTSVVSKPATRVQLSYKAKWADNYPRQGTVAVSSDWVRLTAPCPSPSPSPSKSPSQSPSPSKPPTTTSATPPASTTAPVPSTSTTPGLPVTGSDTTLPMVGTGAALVAGGAVLVAVLRRRRRIQFTAE